MDKDEAWHTYASDQYREYIERMPELTRMLVIEAFWFGWMEGKEAERSDGS